MPTFTDVLIDQYQTSRDLLILLNYAIDNDRFDVYHAAECACSIANAIRNGTSNRPIPIPTRTQNTAIEFYPVLKRELELSQIALVTLNFDIGRLLTPEWLEALDIKVASLHEV